jgi:hypothetical protein
VGAVRGVVAARGVPGGGSTMAALRDLSVIADWAAPALCALSPERERAEEMDDLSSSANA